MRKQVNTERHHVILRKGDMEKLKVLLPKIGASAFIRQMVSNAIDMMEREAAIETRRIEGIIQDDRLKQLIAESLDDENTSGTSEADELERSVSSAPGYAYR